jgi:hypothetical protein
MLAGVPTGTSTSGSVLGGAREEGVAREHPGPRRAAEHDDVAHLRHGVADARQQPGLLGVGIHHRRVGVADDVGGLVRGEAVVERHHHRADLGQRVGHAQHAGRVWPAPDHLLARLHAETQQHVGEPVGLPVQLAPRPRGDGGARPVIDHRRLVTEGDGVVGQIGPDDGHQR